MTANTASKFLSLILRHKPEEIGLVLDEYGWADIDDLLRLSEQKGTQLSRALLDEVVANSDKKRFLISADRSKIRANQGHSVSVDLGLKPQTPPSILYHGTATRFIESIRADGLTKGSRQHVHLSVDEATAIKVGKRHGTPAILTVAAEEMVLSGHVFYCSENGVWLVDHVPVTFLGFGA